MASCIHHWPFPCMHVWNWFCKYFTWNVSMQNCWCQLFSPFIRCAKKYWPSFSPLIVQAKEDSNVAGVSISTSLGMNSPMFVNCSIFCDIRHVWSSVLGQNVMFGKFDVWTFNVQSVQRSVFWCSFQDYNLATMC